jgi:pimeloyl-ACP methyl ester carboxylesterase
LSIAGAFRGAAIRFGAPPEAVRNLGEIDQTLLEALERAMVADRKLRWSVMRRGFWVNGAADLRGYFRAVEAFTMEGRAELIRCPTLLTWPEHDPLAAHAQVFFDALRCPRTLMRFTAAEGAGGHCEMTNRSLLNDRVLDWLDDVLASE